LIERLFGSAITSIAGLGKAFSKTYTATKTLNQHMNYIASTTGYSKIGKPKMKQSLFKSSNDDYAEFMKNRELNIFGWPRDSILYSTHSTTSMTSTTSTL